jgi:hypothetical protein
VGWDYQNFVRLFLRIALTTKANQISTDGSCDKLHYEAVRNVLKMILGNFVNTLVDVEVKGNSLKAERRYKVFIRSLRGYSPNILRSSYDKFMII